MVPWSDLVKAPWVPLNAAGTVDCRLVVRMKLRVQNDLPELVQGPEAADTICLSDVVSLGLGIN